jgi:hypothetical protein
MSPDRWWRQSRNQKRPHRAYECLGITNRSQASRRGRDNALISGPCQITRQVARREEIPNDLPERVPGIQRAGPQPDGSIRAGSPRTPQYSRAGLNPSFTTI